MFHPVRKRRREKDKRENKEGEKKRGKRKREKKKKKKTQDNASPRELEEGEELNYVRKKDSDK